jgi:hypothetical protein
MTFQILKNDPPSPISLFKKKEEGEENKTYMAIKAEYFNLVTIGPL